MITDLNTFVESIKPQNIKIDTKIISAFPGTGKTTYFNKHKEDCIDSDSSNFSWIIDEDGNKVRNPEFPNNYINNIKENIGKYKYIFVSSHDDVRNMLLENDLFFYLLYPSIDRKNEFIERYKNRGSDEKFVALLEKNWNEWITTINNTEEQGFKKYCLEEGNNMEEILPLL